MPSFLYKYMPLREEFFDNFLIRATPVSSLNDPYEGLFNKNQLLDLNKNHKEFYEDFDNLGDLDDQEIEESMGHIQADLNGSGIISLCADGENHLMWAHYADEHKGMLIQFDNSKPLFANSIRDIEGRLCRFKKDIFGTTSEEPKLVTYQKELPTFSQASEANPDNPNDFYLKKFHKKILFSKADIWSYENEYRSIVDLSEADSIICKANEILRHTCSKYSEITVKDLENNRIQITFPDEYEMHEDMGDESVRDEIFYQTCCIDSIKLFKINPKAISSIYFGARSNKQLIRELCNKIRENQDLSHLENKIYRMEVDANQYKLEPISINSILL